MHEEEPRAINRYMNKAATSALKGVDVVVFVLDQLAWTTADELVLEKLSSLKCPVILAINKVDKIEKRETLLPHLDMLSRKRDFAEMIPVSALRQTNLLPLEECVGRFLPQSVHFYPDDQITDRSERFMASEMVREKITRQLGAELPYSVAVEIEEFKHDGKTLHVSAVILVEREGQKKIIIGDKGDRLRSIGQDARIDMERMFDNKVMLRLWVKVKRGWADSERALKSLGMNDF
jgi:GTP-binding protein Era